MAIREDLVESAAKFLQDPSVASSNIDNKIAFLQSKNLTKEEVDAALARVGGLEAAQPIQQTVAPQPPPYSRPVEPYGAYQQPPRYGLQQQQAPPIPKRDWRDWFIMATVMGGFGIGLYTFTKRYIAPLIKPRSPEKLDEDKQQINDRFEELFALIDQMSADTTELKNAEKERTDSLDKTMSSLQTTISDLETANRRHDDDARRFRDSIAELTRSIPLALDAQKELGDKRLRDINQEMKSLKTLISQRLAAPTALPVSTATTPAVAPSTDVMLQPTSVGEEGKAAARAPVEEATGTVPATAPPKPYNDYVSGLNRTSPFSSGMPPSSASIPAWQMAMATKSTTAAPGPDTAGSDTLAATNVPS